MIKAICQYIFQSLYKHSFCGHALRAMQTTCAATKMEYPQLMYFASIKLKQYVRYFSDYLSHHKAHHQLNRNECVRTAQTDLVVLNVLETQPAYHDYL